MDRGWLEYSVNALGYEETRQPGTNGKNAAYRSQRRFLIWTGKCVLQELWCVGVCRVKYRRYRNKRGNLCNGGMHEGYGYIRRVEARRLIRSSVSLCKSSGSPFTETGDE